MVRSLKDTQPTLWLNLQGLADSVARLRLDMRALDTSNIISGYLSTARLGSGTANGTTYLRGDGTWATLPVSGGAWGAITGTLSAQTDLQAALNAKQPLAAVLTNTTASFTTAQEVKLSNIATGATVNAADAALRDRATHTGVQAISTVTGLQAALDGKQPAGTYVTSVNGTGTVSGLTLTGSVASTGSLVLGGALVVTASNFASQTANTFLAGPNGATGVPTFRTIVAADVPTLNQSTTGSAATLTTGRTIAMTGDVAWTSSSFNGGANVTGTATLATVNSNVGTFGSATLVPVVTVNAKGLVTAVSTVAVSGGGGGGGGPTYGTATLDFGAFPGSNEASVTFADTSVGGTSKINAFIMSADSTVDHTANDHKYAAMLMSLSAEPNAGVGGVIYARSFEKLQGSFSVRYSLAA